MPELPEKYKKLIALGIDKSANLPDLNNMTDRGAHPMKPWTAAKTVGTMALIKKYNITDEETFVKKFQQYSKIPLENLADTVYEHQLNYFGSYKYDKDTIFRYTYCCVVVNSLMGNSTENKFESWAARNKILIKNPPAILDQKYHTDRIEVDQEGKVTGFISIKPNSFYDNSLQYTDVYAGLQVISEVSGIPWKIYFRENESFRLIHFSDQRPEIQKIIKELAANYSQGKKDELKLILSNLG